MLAKVLVLAVAVVAASCENRYYRLKTVLQQHGAPKEYRYHPQEEAPKEYRYHAQEEAPKEYRYHTQEESPKEYSYHPQEHIPVREYQEAPVSAEQYKSPQNHAHAFSSQSIVHHGQTAAYEESQESNTEHVAPVYQYVDEQNEEQNAHHAAPLQHKYQAVHYSAPAPVQHEIQTIEVPHHKVPSHYQTESHEAYHHEVPHNAPQHAPHHEAPVYHGTESHESHDEPIDYYAYPKYQYEYKVEDPHTGDNKFQHETRDGDVVKGAYGLHEADGSIRTVEYSSDKHHGFSAIVKHSSPGQHVHIESHHKN